MNKTKPRVSKLDPLFCKVHQPESQTARGGGLYPRPAENWGVHTIYMTILFMIPIKAVTIRGYRSA